MARGHRCRNIGRPASPRTPHAMTAAVAAGPLQGSKPFAPTTRAKVSFHPGTREIDYRVFTVHDPDGIAVEFVDKVVMAPSGFAQVPATVAHNTPNVKKYFPFTHKLLTPQYIQA